MSSSIADPGAPVDPLFGHRESIAELNVGDLIADYIDDYKSYEMYVITEQRQFGRFCRWRAVCVASPHWPHRVGIQFTLLPSYRFFHVSVIRR